MWTEMVVAEFPVTVSARPRSGRGFRWGAWQHGEPRTACRRPPPLYVALRDRGPLTILRLGAPIRACIRGPVGRWAHTGEINLTFSPLISTLLLTLYFLVYLFHHILVHRACFIITTQLPLESYGYNIRYVQKQILFLLALSRNHKAFP